MMTPARSLLSVVSLSAGTLIAAATAVPFALATMPAMDAPAPRSVGAPVVSKPFSGAKANTGTVALDWKDGRATLTLSTDFKTPDTPAPHWQIVDSAGNTYLLERLKTKDKDDQGNRSIVVPEYVHDIAKVQI